MDWKCMKCGKHGHGMFWYWMKLIDSSQRTAPRIGIVCEGCAGDDKATKANFIGWLTFLSYWESKEDRPLCQVRGSKGVRQCDENSIPRGCEIVSLYAKVRCDGCKVITLHHELFFFTLIQPSAIQFLSEFSHILYL